MQRINPILEEAFPLTDEIGRGRPRLPMSKVFNGLLFQIRTGIQWEQMPERFGHYSTIHRWKTKMHRAGVFYKIMALFILEADSLGLIDWSVQALDGSYAKARLGGDGIGQNPTDRAKSGIKRSVLSDSTGMPLAVFVAGANIHDSLLVEQNLAAWVKPKNYTGTQVLLLDRGYRGQTVKNTVESHGYEYRAPALNKDNPYHILDQEYTLDDNRQRAAIEWSHSYMQQYRTVMTRFSRKARNYEADCQFACFMIAYGRILDKLAVG